MRTLQNYLDGLPEICVCLKGWETPEEWIDEIDERPIERPTHRQRRGDVNRLALFGEEAGEILAAELAEQLPTDAERAAAETLDNAERRTPTERRVLSEDRPEPNRTDIAYLALWKTWQQEEKALLSTLPWQDQEDIRQTIALNCWQHAYRAESLQKRTSRINWIREEIQRHRERISRTIGTASGSSEEAQELRSLSLESKIEAQERNHLAEVHAKKQPKRTAIRLL